MHISEYSEPYTIFTQWLKAQKLVTKNDYPSACVLSTQGLDGYPNARNVSLKTVEEPYFIVTGSTTSRKGKEIEKNPKVALTFWWDETKRQVRIQGTATRLSEQQADYYFKNRTYESQIISSISDQGDIAHHIESLRVRFRESIKSKQPVTKPRHWGGWKIKPHRIEFLEFEPSRFHNRILYTYSEEKWNITQLQP